MKRSFMALLLQTISVGIMLSMPWILQMFLLRSLMYLNHTYKKPKNKIKIQRTSISVPTTNWLLS